MKKINKLHYNDKYNFNSLKIQRGRQLKNSAILNLYKDKTFDHYYLDQLLNLICLYINECDNKEIIYWLYYDWGLKIKPDVLKLILKKLSCRRLFPKTNKYYILKNTNTYNNNSDIINYKGILFTTNKNYSSSFLYFRDGYNDDFGVRQTIKIGNPLSFVEFLNEKNESLDIVDVLIIKRFSNAYNISDLNLIDIWCDYHNKEINKIELNKILVNIQSNFIKDFLEVNKRLRN